MRDGLEFLQGGLSFPFAGKWYVVPPMGMRTAMRLRRVADGGEDPEMSALVGEAAYKFVLRSAYEQMLEDDVPQEIVERAFQATMAYLQTLDPTIADQVWEAGSIPEFRAALEAAALKTVNSTAAAGKTRSRASSSGTSTRRATKSAPKVKAIPSRGR